MTKKDKKMMMLLDILLAYTHKTKDTKGRSRIKKEIEKIIKKYK